MKNIKYIITVVVAAFVITPMFNSCDFLDVSDDFNELLQYDSIFHNKANLERYLFATADMFKEEGGIFGNTVYTPGIMATDEAFSLGTAYNGLGLVLGEVTASNARGINIYGDMYKIIRKTNNILLRMDEAVDMTASDKQDFAAYAHFMRGYAYYNLVNLYGPVVILGDDVLETNETPEYYARYRSTYDECIDYICDEFELAARFLPIENPISQFGRPTKGAALALIARMRLQQASPLFNGGSAAKVYFGSFTRSSDNVHYISQQYNEERWAQAALAAKKVMDMSIYRLHTVESNNSTPSLPATVPTADFPYGAGNIDPYHSYSDMFTGETLAARNPEFIWARNSPQVKEFTRRSFPVQTFRGYNNLCVTQKIVDAYYMDDGRTIEEAKSDGYYSETGYLTGKKTFSGYELGPNVHNMYINREKRFYASVAFSNSWWTATSAAETENKMKQISYESNGLGGKNNTGTDENSYPITGYTLKKYIHAEDAWTDKAVVLDKPFPIIRYAEILLSYVEALNNLTTTYTMLDEFGGQSYTITRNTDEMKFYFNQIRFRAGLPGITDADVADPQRMQELIERERMIEFMCENRRYFDVRRWGIYSESEREPMLGMDTDTDGDAYYNRVPLNHSLARRRDGSDNKKYVFMPIMLSELRKAPTLDQNPGWEN